MSSSRKRRIREHGWRDRVVLVLLNQRGADGVADAALGADTRAAEILCQADSAAAASVLVHGLVGPPGRSREAQRKPTLNEEGFGEAASKPLLERRRLRFDLAGARAAAKIHVPPVDSAARFLFGAISGRQLQTPMLPFGHRDHDRHLWRPIFGKARHDVDELKQLEAVEAPLRLGNAAELVLIALVERELPANDVFVDRDVALRW